MSGFWVFGYGSLVSPSSFARTLGRDLTPGDDFHEADLNGFGRRWNYGTMRTVEAPHPETAVGRLWTIVALGLVEAPGESTNGVIGWVSEHEVPALDRRERRYDRVDVTAQVTTIAGLEHPVMTYVPRPEPIADYESARDRGTGAITSHYWNLVDGAFADLGADQRDRYYATTPAPDVPIVDVPPELLAGHHRPAAS